jgi:hypothetical protein
MFDVITEMTQFTLAYSNPSTTNNIKLVTHNTTRTGDQDLMLCTFTKNTYISARNVPAQQRYSFEPISLDRTVPFGLDSGRGTELLYCSTTRRVRPFISRIPYREKNERKRPS